MKILIAGNGPSLRDVRFENLRNVAWLGMNAAYRHWDKIKIYPTIYCCLDGVVVRSHAKEILRMHSEGCIEKFFLTKEILEEIPDFPRDERVFFLDEVVKLDGPAAKIFRSAYPDKLTTGSWAARFAIYLGYTEIYLAGIDCNYVEVIPEAAASGVGLELQITRKVQSNPNYFFDDYQQPGDVYQVPNPTPHFGNLHLQSFEALVVDIQRLGIDVSIFNTSPNSQLARFGVFPFTKLARAFGQPCLEALAVPLTRRECDQFVRNLLVWDRPAFHPLRPNSPLAGKIQLHLFFDCDYSREIVEQIQLAWGKLNYLPQMFKGLKISFLDIPDDLNLYIRDAKFTEAPRKTGPNLHFLAMMRRCQSYSYVQLMETDCVPAKADWLADFDEFCAGPDDFWIAGAFLPDIGTIYPWLALHLNGNALYASGNPGFIEFLKETFAPALRYLVIDKKEFSLAYDCLLARLIHYGVNGGNPGLAPLTPRDPVLDGYFREVQKNLDRFRPLRYIRNVSHIDSQFTEDQLIAMLDSDCVLVHSRALSSAIADLCEQDVSWRAAENNILSRRLCDAFIRVCGAIPLTSAYTTLEPLRVAKLDPSKGAALIEVDQEAFEDTESTHAAYLVFHVDHDVTGKELNCDVSIRSEVEQVLDVYFAREGSGTYIADGCRVRVAPEESVLKTLSVRCAEDYSKFRVTVKPVSGDAGQFELRATLNSHRNTQSEVSVSMDGDPVADEVALFEMFQYPPLIDASVRQGGVEATGTSVRVLILDVIPMGRAGSATGQLKHALFGGWAPGTLLQVWEDPADLDHPFKMFAPPESWEASRSQSLTEGAVIQKCNDFSPDVIYVRPTDSLRMLELAERLKQKLDGAVKVVVHMMDDWPERLRKEKPEIFASVDPLLRALISDASATISISESMSRAYSERYGGQWTVVANGIDPDEFSRHGPDDRRNPGETGFLIRYMGGLAEDMNFRSVLDVAQAVTKLSAELDVRLDICTMPWYIDAIRDATEGMPVVDVREIVPGDKYFDTLMDSNALLLAYNFDEATKTYTRYSMANKLPECLASGVPLLAYGPQGIATIDYLLDHELGFAVVNRDEGELVATIRELVFNATRAQQVAHKARRHAFKKLRLDSMRQTLVSALTREAASEADLGPASTSSGALTFKDANILFRKGSYEKALEVYRRLAAESGWSVYRENAELCEKKMSAHARASSCSQ